MTNKETLKKQIIYRSSHRGSKEMDILLESFVKKYIETFDEYELKSLNELLLFEDEILYNWYFEKQDNLKISKNEISKKLKNFKL
tara:strand:+ start:11603 stop:11857 length:255 start_codon:yes stop_codon:yes gene_type:complete